jgi:hypothetical protein
MQARHLLKELMPPGWQYEQACSVCKVSLSHAKDTDTDLDYDFLFIVYHAIYGKYEGLYQVVLDFIWVVYIIPNASPSPSVYLLAGTMTL